MSENKDDTQYQERTLTSVEGSKNAGWSVGMDDGWSCFVPPEAPIDPQPGMTIRLYGKGAGHSFRGMLLDGHRVFYRNEADDEQYRLTQMYGRDAADWLDRWDMGKTVWSVEMGGLGPGYEQAIQITAAEILRVMLEKNYPRDQLNTYEIEQAVWAKGDDLPPTMRELSGAQWGAAMGLAANLYRRGPIECFTDEAVKDRKIQVERTFPQ